MLYKIGIDLGQVSRDLGSSRVVYYEVFIYELKGLGEQAVTIAP